MAPKVNASFLNFNQICTSHFPQKLIGNSQQNQKNNHIFPI